MPGACHTAFKELEPDELRGSRPVPWEGGGAIPLPDPIMHKARRENSTKKMSDLTHKNCIFESNKTT